MGNSIPAPDEGLPEAAELHGDEDAFTPAQMEEFRRLANSRASNRSVKMGGIVTQTEMPRPPTSASIRVPSRYGEYMLCVFRGWGGGGDLLFSVALRPQRP